VLESAAAISSQCREAVIVAIVSEGEELSTVRANVVLDTLQRSGAMFTTSAWHAGHDGNPSFARRDARRDSTESEAVQRNTVVGRAQRIPGAAVNSALTNGIEPLMLSFRGRAGGTVRGDVRDLRGSGTARGDHLASGIKLRAPARVGEK
jgi:hypothetical protein